MALTAAVSALTDTGQRVGRYFSIVNLLTSVIAVAVPTALVSAGAPRRPPHWSALAGAFDAVTLGRSLLLVLAVIAAGILLAPLQFGTTQLLEGYWGNRPLARRAMARSTRFHLERYQQSFAQEQRAETVLEDIQVQIDEARRIAESLPKGRRQDRAWRAHAALVHERVSHLVDYQEAWRFNTRYPVDVRDVMPTALGNMLRRHERLAGRSFGLDAVHVMPAIAHIGGERELTYHDDARSALDLAVRMVVVWSFLAMFTAGLLWPYALWMGVPLACALLAALSYRGAIAAAAQYGSAIHVTIALNRRELYRRLGLPLPSTRQDESAIAWTANRMLAADLPTVDSQLDFP